jgi:hypothetical protein
MHGLVTVHGHGGRQDFKDRLYNVILMSRDFYVNLVMRLLGRIEIGQVFLYLTFFPNFV